MNAVKDVTVLEALAMQAASCRAIGSELYGVLLDGLAEDHRRGGPTAQLLDGVTDTPLHDALPLRYLATAHLLALQGDAPQLAARYPSCGGAWVPRPDIVDDFLTVVENHREEFERGVRRNVQTNEVGRAGVLASGFALLGTRHGLRLDQLEIGSSAGLLSRWDRFSYDTGVSRAGDPASSVQFGPEWWTGDRRPDLIRAPEVARRRACDIAPIDVTAPDGRLRALSFIWPDQAERFARLDAAIEIARHVPVTVDAADAGAWLHEQLGRGVAPGHTTVVFHSIVWQYLPATTKDAVRSVLATAGAAATPSSPLCWLRMEPAGPTADLRLTTWPGGQEEQLATVGYHGAGITWLV